MKTSWYIAALLTLPILAQDTAPATPALSCDDAKMEQNLAELKETASQGDAYSQRQVYLRYAQKGHSVQAAAWADVLIDNLTRKANEGDMKAMWMLARLFLTGDGVIPADSVRSVEWFSKLSDAGEGKKILFSGDLSQNLKYDDFPEIAKTKELDLFICEMAHFDFEVLRPHFEGSFQMNSIQ